MIVLCVTGSVAATQAIKLAREFKRQGVEVKCFMSEAACKIIHPNSMEFATGSRKHRACPILSGRLDSCGSGYR